MNTIFFRVWKYPILLGALTIFGLLAALIGTGIWHVFSWIALAIPLGVGIRYSFKR
jgi:hypothetical protein